MNKSTDDDDALMVTADSVFGFSLTTHRDKDLGVDAPSFFQYECAIAAISVCFFRMTIRSHREEPFLLRVFFALLLAALAYLRKPYELIVALQMFSYAVPPLLILNVDRLPRFSSSMPPTLVRLACIATSAILSMVLAHHILSDDFYVVAATITPSSIRKLVLYLFPVEEMQQAYDIIANFVDPGVLRKQISHLLFVTFNVQVCMGYLGIEFLKREQQRRNDLVRMDMSSDDDEEEESNTTTNGATTTNGTTKGEKAPLKQSVQEKQLKASSRFQRGAAPFILLTAAPYMFQIIAFGNMNYFAYTCLHDDIHRAVRLNQLFNHDSHLVAMAADSATSPDGTYKCRRCCCCSAV